MKIIKEGRPLRPVTFECEYCGCVFEADRTEYGLNCYTTVFYNCRCPHCMHQAGAPWDDPAEEDDNEI